jgi:ribosome-interacting GTPase 1
VKKLVKPDICISAEMKINIDNLKELIFQRLGFMRVFCKEVGKKADMGEPMIMKSGSNLRDVCEKLHRDFVSKFTFARIWGKSAKFDGQGIRSLDHQLKDEDIVEIHTR